MATVNTSGTKLTDAQRDAIEDAVEAAQGEMVTDYSGRGMHGEHCIGFTGNDRTLAKFFFAVGRSEVLADNDNGLRLASRLKSDSMGRSTIYYFPGFEF